MPDRSRSHVSPSEASLELEERFAVVPEWLLDAPVSDCAVRLYAVLLRYGQVSGARMPSRATLARRLHKKSTDTVDRAMRELVDLGAVTVTARWAGRERLTNAYRIRASRPSSESSAIAPAQSDEDSGGGRIDAATPRHAADAKPAAGRVRRVGGARTDRVTVAAGMRHNPEFFTERENPPPAPSSPSSDEAGIAAICGIPTWGEFGDACRQARIDAGQPTGRWSNPCIGAALQLAVKARGWPADDAASALLHVASDPATRSPMRVAEAGPWWDRQPSRLLSDGDRAEVEAAEFELAEAGGLRVVVQREARAQLRAEGRPLNRRTVALRARELLGADGRPVGDGAGASSSRALSSAAVFSADRSLAPAALATGKGV